MPSAKHASPSCAHSAMPTYNRPKRAHGVNGHSGRQLDLLETFGSTAPLGPHQPSSLRPPPPRPLRRQQILTALLDHHSQPSPPLPVLLLPLLLLFLLLLLLLLNRPSVCRCGVCHAHQHYTQS
nr:unnamed protein product [Spirometra erinaceieuropaei]